jgi:hypothetical protein
MVARSSSKLSRYAVYTLLSLGAKLGGFCTRWHVVVEFITAYIPSQFGRFESFNQVPPEQVRPPITSDSQPHHARADAADATVRYSQQSPDLITTGTEQHVRALQLNASWFDQWE